MYALKNAVYLKLLIEHQVGNTKQWTRDKFIRSHSFQQIILYFWRITISLITIHPFINVNICILFYFPFAHRAIYSFNDI